MRAKLAAVLLGAGLLAWFGRLLAHAKRPAPEGHWRELDLNEGP
jgi:hypothetical protein